MSQALAELLNLCGTLSNMGDGIGKGYDTVARAYAARFSNELDDKPFDRDVLDAFARRLAGMGMVVDMGCGPGQIAAFLASRDVEVQGVDLSPQMIEVARELHPGIEFQTGDMRALPFADESLAGLSAMYCIIHIPRDEVTTVLGELRRVLCPGGLLLMSFHVGSRIEHVTEFLEESVSMDFVFFERDEMEGYLRRAGFEIEESRERDPIPGVEAQTQRAYLLARRI
jgi:ubiquinone/menaquinone biosynthesis C-methylase UbiE